MKRLNHRRRCDGMTLVEVVVVTMLTTLVLLGAITGVSRASQMNYANGQRMAAFGLCKEWYEQMRGASYTNVTETTFAPASVRIAHLGGKYRMPLYGQRTCTITELDKPIRKVVQIRVDWTFQGRELQETLDGVIYLKR